LTITYDDPGDEVKTDADELRHQRIIGAAAYLVARWIRNTVAPLPANVRYAARLLGNDLGNSSDSAYYDFLNRVELDENQAAVNVRPLIEGT
jgi:hypothetical protein